MSEPEQIIAACTRDGVTSWQNVARQLGLSVDQARSRYDHGYERAHVWAPSREPVPPAAPEDLVEPADAEIPVTSPYAKGPGLKAEILRYLQNGPASVETIANRLQKTVLSIRKRLNDMQGDFLVCHDDAFPRTWHLTAKGLRTAVTGHESRAKERA